MQTTTTTSQSNSSKFELDGAGDLFGAQGTSDFASAPSQAYRDTLALIAGAAPTPIAQRDEAASAALLARLLENWRILPSLSSDLVEQVMPEILQPADSARLRNCWLAVSAFAKAQFVACFPLVEALERENVRYSLLKGAATGFRLYEQPYMRASWDNDVGVTRQDVRFAEQLALGVGFVRAQYNQKRDRFERADPILRAEVESQHYELGFLVRRVGVTNLSAATVEALKAEPWTHWYFKDIESANPWCYANLDIHHALSLDIPVEQLLATAHRASSSGKSAIIPNDAWLAAHLIFKIYWEGVHEYRKGLYQFADVVRLVPLLDSAMFESLIEILERHNMVAAAHYVLRRVPLFGVALPAHVAAFVEDTFTPPAGAKSMQLNDLGDMWARVWGLR